MRIALAQYAMADAVDTNLDRVVAAMEDASQVGADLVLFPELCLSPFFPRLAGGNADRYLLGIDDPPLKAIGAAAARLGIWTVPNVYLAAADARYDASLMIAPNGAVRGISTMVHVAQAPGFYEQDYYTPSTTGFIVYDTPHARFGIVICFDRHFPESIRACVIRGAQVILIPTANTAAEPSDMFEWEMCVAARQNGVWIAMCNRVGIEGDTSFYGGSIVVTPDGDLFAKVGGDAELLVADIDVKAADAAWQRTHYLAHLRPDLYR